MAIPLHVLIIEDSEDDAALILLELRRGGYDPICIRVDTPEAMSSALCDQEWEIILSDYAMPHFSGIAALRLLKETSLDIPFIIVSGHIGEEVAVDAMRSGANDYIMKGNLARLTLAISRELQEAALRKEKKHSEQILREKEQLLSKSQEIAHIGSWELDLTINKLVWSDEVYRIFGLQPNESPSTYEAFFDTVYPEDRDAVDLAYSTSLRKDLDSYDITHRIVRKHTGEIRDVYEKCEHVRDACGKIVKSIGIVMDITDRKRMEENLQERNALFAKISSQVPGMLYQFVRKPDGNYTVPYSNDGIKDIFGCSPEDVKNTFEPIQKVVLPEDLNRLVQTINESTKKLLPWICEYRVKLPGESVKWILGNSIPEQMADGTIIWSGYNTDITERKKTEESLRQNEENLKSLFNAIYESVCLVDYNCIVITANETFAARLNRRVEDCIGQSIYSLLSTDIAAKRKVYFDEALLTIQPVNFEDERQGHWYHHSIIPVVNIDGNVDRLAMYAMDITEHKQVEAERKAVIDLLKLINTPYDFRETVRLVLEYLRNWTGCVAVGVRLRDGDDYPYYETHGFPDEFVHVENKLCQLDEKGEIVRDSEGSPYLECLCGNILQGRIDPKMPFFTEHGSFWTNSTTDFQASTTEADRLTHTRNRCNREGYESVALVPLRSGGETMGLIQLNDKQRGRFTPEMIDLIERMGENFASALKEKQTRAALKESEEKHRLLFESAGDAILIHDEGGRILSVNQLACERLGYIYEELVSMSIDQVDIFKKTLNAADRNTQLIQHGHLSFETMHRCKDGSLIPIEVSARRITWKSQLVVMSICRDITERKRAEEEKRQFYRDTINSVTQGKLDLISLDEVKEYLNSTELEMNVLSPADTEAARHDIVNLAISIGLNDDRLALFETAVGEAITNAIKHADDGRIYAGVRSNSFWVAISDNGPGISALTLPGADTSQRIFNQGIYGYGVYNNDGGSGRDKVMHGI